ncbi:MAG: DUF1853 family protein [Neisseria zoodegmatis]|uniref:DUF1853 family protein n=1 Tax=Neisseria zoodegmatis TaxID=326523 RepID=UPI0026F18446|nr:DUF1853 family protein [Neisseria zoodegmatis]MDO5068679.1 DUF1853 family protein [Neisseria zoodegmatis]
MNYALDAIWWRLIDPHVRDLAAILTAPPLWQTGCELPVTELLGDTGFRYLLDLNDHPQQLHEMVKHNQPFANRLGFYAEHLLAFWLETASHASLLGRNVVLKNAAGQTSGAADFIATLNGQPYHIELTCKFYGCRSGRPSEMVGLDAQDTLQHKAAKLPQQLRLLEQEEGRKTLQTLKLAPQEVHPVSIVRGVGFSAQPQAGREAPLNPYGWHGVYIEDWSEYDFLRNAHTSFADGLERRYAHLPRLSWLAPARVRLEDTLDAAETRTIRSGIVAALEQRPDGLWHEVQRMMKVERGG